jgi:hypothetical protein
MEDVVKERRRQRIKKYVDVNSKSPVTGVLYALFYGPLVVHAESYVIDSDYAYHSVCAQPNHFDSPKRPPQF